MKVLTFLTSILALLFSGLALYFSLKAYRLKKEKMTELTLQRLNLIDEKGNLRLVLATGDRIPGPRLNGKEYPKEIREGSREFSPAGFIFYNSDGDEMGGMLWSGGKRKDGTYNQDFYFSLDPYRSNEIFNMGILDDNGKKVIWVKFMDWPIKPEEFVEMIEKSAEAYKYRNTNPEKAEEITKKIHEKIKRLREQGIWPINYFTLVNYSTLEKKPEGETFMTFGNSEGKEILKIGVNKESKPIINPAKSNK